uniref:Uncharacterized protein n=1 Tax=Rhodnius prolixus TaxID=13249 RepID=T1HT98_RHOPR
MSDELLKKLQHPSTSHNRTYKKVSELEVDRPYLISSFARVEKTKFGPAIVVQIRDIDDTTSWIFLPRRYTSSITDQDIQHYMDGDLSLIYKGISKTASVT